MKRILRFYVISTTALYTVSQTAIGMVFSKGTETLLLAGVGLAIASLLVKPIINILLLPINLITFGLFRWVSSAIALYIVTLIVKDFRIDKFFIEGTQTTWFDIPTIDLAGIFAFVAFSFLLSIVVSFIHWLFK